jgi:hypothetical protein
MKSVTYKLNTRTRIESVIGKQIGIKAIDKIWDGVSNDVSGNIFLQILSYIYFNHLRRQ